jgi:Rad3-related DNA helicase
MLEFAIFEHARYDPPMTELTTLLQHLGYDERPQQTKLFEHLITMDHDGIIAQAGTGVGKSIAILAAAAHLRKKYDHQVLVVTPTRILMDQYLKRDAPESGKCFGMEVRELRGRRWYYCQVSAEMGAEDEGCLGRDGDCTESRWLKERYRCDYRDAKMAARDADIVVTNSDLLIVNDRLLPGEFFDPDGPLLIDEAHQFEPKLRDWADRSLRGEWIARYSPDGRRLADWISRFKGNPQTVQDQKQLPELIGAILSSMEDEVSPSRRTLQMQDSLAKIKARLDKPTDNALIWCDGEALKLSWIDVAAAAAELLRARPFGLVSATIPPSMPSSLGLNDTTVIDVGHPFDYAKQATVDISDINGAYQYAKFPTNIEKRARQIEAEVLAAKGGALLLFSSFKDLEAVYEHTFKAFKEAGLLVLKQGGGLENAELAEAFKRDGNAVLFGSESFATGFDVPGDALRLVVAFKLPYAGKDPVTEALMKRFYPRYKDQMLMRLTQALGRLIRTETDRGRAFIADSRAEEFLAGTTLMTAHMKQWKREKL